jgi:hypothetical protein
MNLEQFCYTLDICLGNEKLVIEKFFKKYLNDEKELKQLFKLCQKIGIIDKNLKYSYNSLVNSLANYKNAEEFLLKLKIF